MKEFVVFNYPLPKDIEIQNIWEKISSLRHEVYAAELQQYDLNIEQQLEDPGRHFIACMTGNKLAGYISLNPTQRQTLQNFKVFFARNP